MNLIEQRPSEDFKQDQKSKKALTIAGTAVLAVLVLFFIFSKINNNKVCCLGEKTLAGSVESISEEGLYLVTSGANPESGAFEEKKYLISFSGDKTSFISLNFSDDASINTEIKWREVKTGDNVFVYGEAKSEDRILANKVEVINLLPPGPDFTEPVVGNMPPPGSN